MVSTDYEDRTTGEDRTMREVVPPRTCPDNVGRAALPVLGNRDWQGCRQHGSAGSDLEGGRL